MAGPAHEWGHSRGRACGKDRVSHRTYNLTARPIRAINSTPLVLATIAVLAGVHALWFVPSQWLQFFLLTLSFEPHRFLRLAFGIDYSFWPATLLSPLSYTLLHGNLLHLTLNCAFLLAFGTGVQRQLGPWRTSILFLASTLGGAAAVTLSFYITLQATLVVGASGAICGLFGGLVHRWPGRRIPMIVVFVGVNIVFGVLGFPTADGIQAIAWDAHLGGFAVGFLLYPLLRPRPRDPAA